MALCFRSQVLSVDRIEPRPLHVVSYNPEKSEESTQDILQQRIILTTGIPESQLPMELLDIFNVRQDSYDLWLPMLEAAVRHYHPNLGIREGIRDLVAREAVLELSFPPVDGHKPGRINQPPW